MTCPQCGGLCDRDEVDVGPGSVPVGLWGCGECQWVEGQPSVLTCPQCRGTGFRQRGTYWTKTNRLFPLECERCGFWLNQDTQTGAVFRVAGA
jgi:hypothetical protein